LRASAKGWAQLHVKQNPWTSHRRATRQDYEQAALAQGLIAVNSILRDWIKGQITAVECGILSFEAVFLPYAITDDGRPLIDRLSETKLLPEPTRHGSPLEALCYEGSASLRPSPEPQRGRTRSLSQATPTT
jgi:hypothetical protein